MAEWKRRSKERKDIVTADREAVLYCQAWAPSGVLKCITAVHWEAPKSLAVLLLQDQNRQDCLQRRVYHPNMNRVLHIACIK